jgi:TonB-dependent receptor
MVKDVTIKVLIEKCGMSKLILKNDMFGRIRLFYSLLILLFIIAPLHTQAHPGLLHEIIAELSTLKSVSVVDNKYHETDTTSVIHLDENKAPHDDYNPKHKTIITSEQMEFFVDYSVEDALARVPGFQVDHRRKINLRGIGQNRYNVTINGYRMGTTGLGNRSIDLGSISADMVHSIEVINVITPDMDADALAGNVNIVTHRPFGSDLEIGARLGGGANPRYFFYTGPESRLTVDYSQALTEKISISLNLSQQLQNIGHESLTLDYNAFDFGDGYVDVYERVTTSMQTMERNRIGGDLQLTYKPSETTMYYVHGMFFIDDQIQNTHRHIYDTGQDWVRPDSTGAAGRLGSLIYDAHMHDRKIDQYTVQLGAKRLFETFHLNYGVAWSQSRIDQRQLMFPYLVEDLNYNINLEDRNKPIMEMTNVPLLRDGTLDRRRFLFQPVGRVLNEHVDNTFTGRVDLQLPFELGSVKFGSSTILTYKDGFYRETDLSYVNRLNLSHFEVIKRGAFSPFDHYEIPWLIEPGTARYFFKSARPGFIKDEDLERESSDIWNYFTKEQIYSGYGMIELSQGRFRFLGGIRVEHTSNETDGRNVLIDDRGNHVETSIVNRGNNYTHIFPNAQISFVSGDRSSIRLAYTRSISRPDFNLTAPFELKNVSDSLLFRGNPKLNPMLSDNIDLQFDRYLSNFGTFSINLFYRQLSGFVIESQQTIATGEYAEWMGYSYINDDEKATIYGLELMLYQQFDFLPGFLSNFSTFTNYTWSQSEYKVAFRDDKVPLPGHSPHVVNAALQYRLGRISGQVAYHWTARSLVGPEQSTRLAPSIDPTQVVVMDRYQENWTEVSAAIRIKITENFQFWADAYNLLNIERFQYENSRNLYPRIVELRGGRAFRAGVRFIL